MLPRYTATFRTREMFGDKRGKARMAVQRGNTVMHGHVN